VVDLDGLDHRSHVNQFPGSRMAAGCDPIRMAVAVSPAGPCAVALLSLLLYSHHLIRRNCLDTSARWVRLAYFKRPQSSALGYLTNGVSGGHG
jgi:hypothetical protein